MSWLKTILQEIFGLFVDDGRFAITILIWMGLFWWLSPHLPITSAWRAIILFVGLVVILIESAWRQARH